MLEPHAPVGIAHVAVGAVVVQQHVVLEVGRRAQRMLALHQRRAADREHLDRQAQLGVQARVDAAAVAHRHVEVLAREVDHVLGGRYLEVDVGVGLHEAAHARDQPLDREGRRQVDLERGRALRLAQLLRRVHHLLEGFLDARQVGLAGGGERKRLGVAHEQRDAEVLLERLDLVAHGRGRDEELVGRAREAQVPRRDLEGTQRIERGNGARHGGRIPSGAGTGRGPGAFNIFYAMLREKLVCRAAPRFLDCPSHRRTASRDNVN